MSKDSKDKNLSAQDKKPTESRRDGLRVIEMILENHDKEAERRHEIEMSKLKAKVSERKSNKTVLLVCVALFIFFYIVEIAIHILDWSPDIGIRLLLIESVKYTLAAFSGFLLGKK
ncbi:MAG: hypothetical protein FWC76_07155 [Defluviitaleaceae bacterium]|nr:hypothetical protein [Defluviitaleaceae bacterium]